MIRARERERTDFGACKDQIKKGKKRSRAELIAKKAEISLSPVKEKEKSAVSTVTSLDEI